MTVFCPNCGTKNTDEATHCVSCGTELRKPEGRSKKFKGTMMMSGLGTPPGPTPPSGGEATPPPGGAPAAPKKDLAFQATMLGPMSPPQGGAPPPAAGFGQPPHPAGFGQPAQAPTAQPPAAEPPQQGGFGQPPGGAQPPGTGGFGQPPAPAQPGGFGQPQGQPPGGAPSGFGQPPQQQGGGFGQPPQQGGGFGQPPQQGGSFGQPPQGGGFGQPPQQGGGGFGGPPPGGGFGGPPQGGGFGGPPQGGGFGGPPPGQPAGAPGAAPSGGGGGKTWLYVGIGCLVASILGCLGGWFYCKMKVEEGVEQLGGMEGGLQQLGAEVNRLSVMAQLSTIRMSCQTDPSGAGAAQAFHPTVAARYQGEVCKMTQQTVDAFSRNCQNGQQPCSNAALVAGSVDVQYAEAVGADANACYSYTSGTAKVVGCQAATGFQLVHIENLAGIQ